MCGAFTRTFHLLPRFEAQASPTLQDIRKYCNVRGICSREWYHMVSIPGGQASWDSMFGTCCRATMLCFLAVRCDRRTFLLIARGEDVPISSGRSLRIP